MKEKVKILVLCTGNSCRSQMAEGILKSLDASLEVMSAGTRPAKAVSRKAIRVMQEIDIDISSNFPKSVVMFTGEAFDYVITVCGDARDNCPVFSGKVGKRLHIGFEDPSTIAGPEEYQLAQFRKVRDNIMHKMKQFIASIN